jgi:hypothetical protein
VIGEKMQFPFSPKAVGQLLGGLEKLLRILIGGLLKELWKELITN